MKIKESLILYLPQRIIIFPLHLYLNVLISRILNRMHEWDLIKDKKISGKEKYFNFFAEKEILDILSEIKSLYKNLNLKIYTFFKETNISSINSEFLKEENLVIKKISLHFKKICGKYYIEKIPSNLNFNQTKNLFKNLKCGDPTGEELEFLIKLNKD
jgi:hypothetical protein